MFVNITAKKDFEVEIINQIEGDEITDSDIEIIRKGEVLQADTLSEVDNSLHVQFGDGSVAFLDMKLIEVN